MIIDIKEFDEKINDLQRMTIVVIQDLFSNFLINNLNIKYSDILNPRTDNEDLEILIKFSISIYNIEIYLYYDQIEYYINDNKGNTISECNIEDFYPFKEMVLRYKDYLKKDIAMVRAPLS
jgi:hypothetical protein|tara:strand:- start:856 stop:1218 length:363 start_codon:yes stop_codon:yes gene_type:complete